MEHLSVKKEKLEINSKNIARQIRRPKRICGPLRGQEADRKALSGRSPV
jgi:hypothetical protein